MCSLSMSINLTSYSLIRSCFADSKTRFNVSGVSSALMVMMSSFCADRRTFENELRLRPRATFLSQRYGSKPSARRSMLTSATCELSMACSAMPCVSHCVWERACVIAVQIAVRDKFFDRVEQFLEHCRQPFLHKRYPQPETISLPTWSLIFVDSDIDFTGPPTES
jgi:hypothetical protein